MKMQLDIPLNIFAPMINNDSILDVRPPRRINQRRKHRKQRNARRLYRERNQLINNQDTLNRIETLPVQNTNDRMINWFFNGSFI